MDMYLQSEEFGTMFINPIHYVSADRLPCAKYIGDGMWESVDGEIYMVVE